MGHRARGKEYLRVNEYIINYSNIYIILLPICNFYALITNTFVQHYIFMTRAFGHCCNVTIY